MAWIDAMCLNQECGLVADVYTGDGLVPKDFQTPPCRQCGGPTQRLLAAGFSVIDYAKVEGWEGYNYGLGGVTFNRTHAMKIAKERGVEWVGDEGLKQQKEKREEIVEMGHARRKENARRQKEMGPKTIVDGQGRALRGVDKNPKPMDEKQALAERYGRSYGQGKDQVTFMNDSKVGRMVSVEVGGE